LGRATKINLDESLEVSVKIGHPAFLILTQRLVIDVAVADKDVVLKGGEVSHG
jgi:hypothetical protein